MLTVTAVETDKGVEYDFKTKSLAVQWVPGVVVQSFSQAQRGSVSEDEMSSWETDKWNRKQAETTDMETVTSSL